MTSKPTPITELNAFFPAAGKPAPAPKRAVLVAPRFWKPGMTYQQAVAAQQAYWDEVAARAAAKKGGAA